MFTFMFILACQRAPDERWVGSLAGIPVGVESRWLTQEPDGTTRVQRRLELRYRAGDAIVERAEERTDDLPNGAPVPPWSVEFVWSKLPSSAPLPPEADILPALVFPVAEFPRARSAWSADFLVDGAIRHVQVPLRAELAAADRFRWDTRNAEVARRIAYAPDGARTEVSAALGRGSGDCTERADVWVWLANQAGESSRVVTGLVYLDGAIGPGLYPHAWVEVLSGERWIPIDPTFAQVPADATHLPKTEGIGQAGIVSIR